MECNRDCFNCKYVDCIDDNYTPQELFECDKRDKGLICRKDMTDRQLAVYRYNNSEKRKETSKRYMETEKGKENSRKQSHNNYYRHREKKLAKVHMYYRANAEKLKQKQKDYYNANREHILELQRERRRRKKEEMAMEVEKAANN